MSQGEPLKNSFAGYCALITFALGGLSAVLGAFSVGFLLIRGEGFAAFEFSNSLLGWHLLLLFFIVPFAIISLCLSRWRLCAVALSLLLGGWLASVSVMANSFHGDRPPPSWDLDNPADKHPLNGK